MVLIALALFFVFPQIPGIQIHGSSLHVFLTAISFALLGWLVESSAMAAGTLVSIGTLGLAVLVLAPLWLLGFWVIPTFALKLIAELMPSYLTISSWLAAILGGLVVFMTGIVTAGMPNRYRNWWQ